MRTLFADSGFWDSLPAPRDQLHERARALAATLGSATIVTTHMALVEVLDHLAGRGERHRGLAMQMVQDLEARPDVEVIPQSDAQFRAAVERYAAGPDQTWSLTDCGAVAHAYIHARLIKWAS